MSRLRDVAVLLVVVTAGLLSGCASPEAEVRARARFLPGTRPDEVFEAARAMLRREFESVRADREAGRIEAGPVIFTTTHESGTVRDLYGGASRMRRRAMMWVLPRDGGTLTRLRVVIEREDTRRTQAVPRQGYRLADWPAAQTAIDRDAATSAEQNAVWSFVRRDLRTERRLLDALASRFQDVASPDTQTAGR